jgi:hypothetical protein
MCFRAKVRQEAVLFKVDSIQGVSYGPTAATVLNLAQSSTITRIMTYHYNSTIGTKNAAILLLNLTTQSVHGPWSDTRAMTAPPERSKAHQVNWLGRQTTTGWPANRGMRLSMAMNDAYGGLLEYLQGFLTDAA